MSSFVELAPFGMCSKEMRANRSACLEKIYAYRRGFRAGEIRDFNRIEPLEIHEVEYFPLSRRKLEEEMADVLCHTLPVDAGTGVSVVNALEPGE